MKTKLLILTCFCFGIITAQNSKFNAREIKVTSLVEGTILVPELSEKPILAIIIADSGPSDRNGNQQMMENNSLRYLAEGLYKNGIASFRYDKRIVKQMKNRTISEKDIRFDEFIEDAVAVIDLFKRSSEFSKIYVIGHGQGSLIGMIAAQGRADGFISIAGYGQELDDVIVDQLSKQAPGLVDSAREAFDDLRVTGIAVNYSSGLASIFRKDIQPFLRSWMQYDPKVEIEKLNKPVLILIGDEDLQVQLSEAELLRDAVPTAEYKIIRNMNHIMKEMKSDDPLENSKSFNEYKLPVMPELIETISTFIKQ